MRLSILFTALALLGPPSPGAPIDCAAGVRYLGGGGNQRMLKLLRGAQGESARPSINVAPSAPAGPAPAPRENWIAPGQDVEGWQLRPRRN